MIVEEIGDEFEGFFWILLRVSVNRVFGLCLERFGGICFWFFGGFIYFGICVLYLS